MKHKITGIRQTVTLECGNCHKEFEEAGQNALSSAYPGDGPTEGEYAECPHCDQELECSLEEENEDGQ